MLNTSNILTRGNSFNYFHFLDKYSPFMNLIYGDFENKSNVEKLNSIFLENSVIIYIDDMRHSCCKSFKTSHIDNRNVKLIISENWHSNEINSKVKRWPIGFSTKYFTKKFINNGKYLIDKINSDKSVVVKTKLVCNSVKLKGGYNKPKSGGINDRGKMKNIVKSKNYNKIGDSFFLKFNEYLDRIPNYYYSLSPEGNGYDTHRFYELYGMGLIPVTRNSVLSPLYSNFPCVKFVDHWSEILTLKKPDHEFKPDLKLLTVPYWLCKSFMCICRIIFILSKNDIPYILRIIDSIIKLSLSYNVIFYCIDVESKLYIDTLYHIFKVNTIYNDKVFSNIMYDCISKGYFVCYFNIRYSLIDNPFQKMFSLTPNHVITDEKSVLNQNYEKIRSMFFLPTQANIDYFKGVLNNKIDNKIPKISYIHNLDQTYLKI